MSSGLTLRLHQAIEPPGQAETSKQMETETKPAPCPWPSLPAGHLPEGSLSGLSPGAPVRVSGVAAAWGGAYL
jgi:hypothetical protein